MKKTLLLLPFAMLISGFSFAQGDIAEDTITYFDENYKPVSKKIYDTRKREKGLLSIQGDSLNHKILSYRKYQGNIQHKNILDSLLSVTTGREIDASKTMVIIYYPGKDACNSSGSASKAYRKAWYKRLEKKLFKITQTKPIYLYKNDEGIEKYDGIMTWYKDPHNMIERLFFKYHYPCSSFVVISKDGDYISYFGEFAKEGVWDAAKALTEL